LLQKRKNKNYQLRYYNTKYFVNEEALTHWGAVAPKEKKIKIINSDTGTENNFL